MSRRVIVDPSADRDLDDQFEYLARDSADVALRFLSAARETFEELAGMPRMGTLRQVRNPRLAGVRQWRVRGFEKHLIFYREIEDGIEVVRVLHAARDVNAILELG